MSTKNSNEFAMEFFDNLNQHRFLTSTENHNNIYLEFSKFWKNPIPNDLKKSIILMFNTNKNLENIFLLISSYINKEILNNIRENEN